MRLPTNPGGKMFVLISSGLFILCLSPDAGASCGDSMPGWIACEDFERGGQGFSAWFDSSIFTECNGCNGNVNNPARIRLTDAPAEVHSGNWAVCMPAESAAGYQGASLTFRTCSGAKRAGCLLTGYDRLYFRTWVKLAPDHERVHHFLALDGCRPDRYWESDGNAGCRPNGVRWVGTTLDFNTRHELFFYTYYPEMNCDAGGYCSGTYAQDICAGCAAKNMPCLNGLECCWGNHYQPLPAVVLPRGEWVCLEIMMQLNTVGAADGEMAFWINDSLALRVTGMHWRDIPELQLNKAWLQHYIASGDATQSNRVWFDDMAVSTQKIGTGTGVVRHLIPTSKSPNITCCVMPSGTVRMTCGLLAPGDFSIGIFDVHGKRIWNFQGNSGFQKDFFVDWRPGTRAVAAGLYLARLGETGRQSAGSFIVLR